MQDDPDVIFTRFALCDSLKQRHQSLNHPESVGDDGGGANIELSPGNADF
jgi:hypothetical protein